MNDLIEIREWMLADREPVTELIVGIQRDEFGINITAEDQPDLKIVDTVYQKEGGNFWVAVCDQRVVGSVGLIHFQKDAAALRKMFVAPSFRGKDTGVAQRLLDKAVEWCRLKNIDHVYLGTIDVFQSAIRFYEKNGFTRIDPSNLPGLYPRMKVDTLFYHLKTAS